VRLGTEPRALHYKIVRPGGTISRVGVPQYEDAAVGFMSLFGKNATLTDGPTTVRAYIEQVMPQVLDGTINPQRVFDREMPLDDIAEGYASWTPAKPSRCSSVPDSHRREAASSRARPLDA